MMSFIETVAQEVSGLTADGTVVLIGDITTIVLVAVTAAGLYLQAKEGHRHTEKIADDATKDIAHDAAVVKEVVDEEEKRDPGVPLTVHAPDEPLTK